MILIVDDDNAVRLSIGLALKRAGMDSVAVSNEADALARVRGEGALEGVVLDMNLTLSTTGRDGMELLQKIKILRPDLPVILITAWGTIPMAVQAMNLGATDFITKPWSNEELIAKLKKAINTAHEKRENFESLDIIERQSIETTLRRVDGNLSEAARQLGITRQALYRRMEKYGIK